MKNTEHAEFIGNGTEKQKREDNKRNGLFAVIGDETKFRAYIARIFGDSKPTGEEILLRVGKWVLFALLIFMEVLILTQHVELVLGGGHWLPFVALLFMAVVFTVAETVKLFIMQEERHQVLFYVVEIGAACGFLILTEGTYSLILYILLLTQFYFGAGKFRSAVWMFFMVLPLYACSYVLQVHFMRGEVNGIEILRESLGAFVALVLHFLSVQTVLAFYRQYGRLNRTLAELNRTLAELDESKKELENAYSVVAEVTALEERQRIAKEIHDTAGHSLTTVIMQTEAAKRIIDDSPNEAKIKIVAANLQARHTLERLRESIHLLSGTEEGESLKMALENVIHESSDGTGIRIRSEIEDVAVSPAKQRFLCNTLKEGLSNGLRHGGATAFWFELKTENGKLEFLLSDNGKGLGDKTVKYGFGLTTMQNRAKSFGGDVHIVSEPDEGFELRMTLPMDAMK